MHICTCTCIHAYMHTSIHTHTCTHTHAYAYMHMHICMCLGKRAMPDGNTLASALGEDPFIPLNTHSHITRESQSKTKARSYPSKPICTSESDLPSNPLGGASPSPQLADPLNHHESGTGGGSTPTPVGTSARPARLLGSDPGREGVVRPGDPFLLVRAARPRTPIKVTRSWR